MRLLAAIEAEDKAEVHFNEQDVLEEFEDPYCDFPRGSTAVYDGGTMVGFAALTSRTSADPTHEMYQWGGVHPSYRGAGLGGKLLDWSEQAALPVHEARFPGHPLALHSECLSLNERAIALFGARGYRQERWFHLMNVELARSPPGRDAPPSVRIVDFNAENSDVARAIRNEAFRDHWGSTESTPLKWSRLLESSAFRPQFSFLAFEGSQPLGVILCLEFVADAAATGKRDLYVQTVGTVRAARNRGIASALLSRVLQAAKSAGFKTASLNVDADSPTGAVGLYQRAGFSVVNTSVSMVKQLRA